MEVTTIFTESSEGRLSAYLYQLSSTGGYRLIASKINFTSSYVNSTVGPGFINLNLDLSSLNYPSKYHLLFYTAESFKNNEVRQFTSWVNIPPTRLQLTSTPQQYTSKARRGAADSS